MAATAPTKNVKRRTTRRFARRLIDFYLRVASWVPGHWLRISTLRIVGARIGRNVALGRGVIALDPWRLSIGSNTIIGTHVRLDARAGLAIGDNCNISDDVAIWTAEHDIQSPDFVMALGSVSIGDRVWLCFRSIVLPGITVGEGAVVASASVVSRDVPPFSLVGGVPAKGIGERNRNLTYQLGRRQGK
jgi:acetyltransferase-like isoleucine patch superfamily enzyme